MSSESQSCFCPQVTLGLRSFSVLPFSLVGENTGFLPEGQAEVSLMRRPGRTLLLSCMEHPVLVNPCGFLLPSEPARCRQLRELRTPTGLSAQWSGVTQKYRRYRHCSSQNDVGALSVPGIGNLLSAVFLSQALANYQAQWCSSIRAVSVL